MTSVPIRPQSFSAGSVGGGVLRVTFHWQVDRFGHVIEVQGPGEPVMLLASCEGTPQQDWPASPACQQLDPLTLADRHCGLAVGMAGTSHWSLSVEADRHRPQLVFEWACRVKTAPPFLGSTYRAAPDVWDATAAWWNRGSWRLGLQVNTAAPAGTQLQRADATLRLVPTGVSDFAGACSSAQTVRWRYTLQLQAAQP